MYPIPQNAAAAGFVPAGLGPHASRTLALDDLRRLLAACPPGADAARFRAAAEDENVLLKQTWVTRQAAFRHLRALYGLDPRLPIYRALRELWDHDLADQPLLALLRALSRDAALRATSPVILAAQPGETISAPMLAAAAEERLTGRLGPGTLEKIGRNTASTWAQSGHLVGRGDRARALVQPGPLAVAYALLLGYLCGVRGDALFHTPWARLLDIPPYMLHELAHEAGKQGWLEYRHSGGVTEITFRHLLRPDQD